MSRFAPGDRVRVRSARPPGHVRTPWYVRGKTGIVAQLLGEYPNPEELAYGRDGRPPLPLYEVRFDQCEVWGAYEGGARDTLDVDVYESWLESFGGDR